MNKNKEMSMVRDLTLKYPKGPNGTFKKKDYIIQTVWSSPHNKYRDTAVLVPTTSPTSRWGGYSAKEVYSLIKHRSHMEPVIIEAFKGELLTQAAISRRKNNLLQRLSECIDHVQSVGIPGCYKVTWGYGQNSSLYMYGKSKKEVEASASVFNGAFGLDIGATPRVYFLSVATPEQVHKSNQDSLEEARARADAHARSAKDEYEKSLKKLEESKSAIEIFSSILDLHREATNV